MMLLFDDPIKFTHKQMTPYRAEEKRHLNIYTKG